MSTNEQPPLLLTTLEALRDKFTPGCMEHRALSELVERRRSDDRMRTSIDSLLLDLPLKPAPAGPHTFTVGTPLPAGTPPSAYYGVSPSATQTDELRRVTEAREEGRAVGREETRGKYEAESRRQWARVKPYLSAKHESMSWGDIIVSLAEEVKTLRSRVATTEDAPAREVERAARDAYAKGAADVRRKEVEPLKATCRERGLKIDAVMSEMRELREQNYARGAALLRRGCMSMLDYLHASAQGRWRHAEATREANIIATEVQRRIRYFGGEPDFLLKRTDDGSFYSTGGYVLTPEVATRFTSSDEAQRAAAQFTWPWHLYEIAQVRDAELDKLAAGL